MKKFLSSIIIASSFLVTAQSNAALLESTFTSDNQVTGFTYLVDGVQTSFDLSNVANLNNWRLSSTLSANIPTGTNYEFIWDTVNFGKLASNNPVAFLGELTLDGVIYLTNNLEWEVKSDATAGLWQTASLNFGNGSSANNQGNNIWGSTAPSDINSSAQWIWDGSSNGNNDAMSFRLTISGTSTSAVQASSPTVLGLIGFGLLFIAYSSRKK